MDSGNFAVSLIAYAETLREAGAATGLEPQRWTGLGDVLRLLDDALKVIEANQARADVARLKRRLTELPDDAPSRVMLLEDISENVHSPSGFPYR